MPEPLRILSHLPEGLLRPAVEAFPEARVTVVPEEGEPPPDARGEVLLTWAWGAPNVAQVIARGVRWVHAFGTGVDGFALGTLGDATLTCSRGASALAISEWVLACMLAFEKQLPESWIDAPPERWNLASLGGLHGRTVGIVGFGGIAHAVATRCLAFGMRVLAVRRSAAPSDLAGVAIAPSLEAVLPQADHLVVAAPATPATRHLLGREAFARMKEGSHLVNIARGELVDQDALREALDAGRPALASLDVCHPEPLPAGHWLYRHPRVRLSPHVSWSAPWAMDALLAPFVDNLRRYRAGEPLDGVVDVAQGY